jgi:uncharacterized small protein (DUF1192 family)
VTDDQARKYIEQRLREGGLRLVSGSPTMLQDEFARLQAELATPPSPALNEELSDDR